MTAQTVSSAVAERKASPVGFMWQRREHFASVLPKSVDVEAFLGTAAAALYSAQASGKPGTTLWDAAVASPDSLITALMRCAALGHMPGTDEFYLTPRNVKGRLSVLGIEGYRGVIERMYRSGAVANVVVREVCAKDKFKFVEGDMDKPSHHFGGGDGFRNETGADFFGANGSRDRGPMVGAYAYAKLLTGAYSRVVLLTRDDWEAARAAGGWKPGDPYSPWNRLDAGENHPEFTGRSMVWKTAAKRLEPWVPTSREYRAEMMRASARAGAPLPAAAGPVMAVQAAADDDIHDAEIVEERPPADTPSSERAKREARPPQPASDEALGKLRGLLASLPLAAPEERDAAEMDVLAWLGGGRWDGTRGQVQMATGQLEDFISAAGGDLEKAVSDLWQRYRDAHPEAGDG